MKRLINIVVLLVICSAFASYADTAADPNSNGVDNTPLKYRLLLNDEVIVEKDFPNESPFTITQAYPENTMLKTVTDRTFSYIISEKSVEMRAQGKNTCAIQLMSAPNIWGVPFISTIEGLPVKTKLSADSIAIPDKYTFKKVDNHNFKAFRFSNNYSGYIYVKPDQDCYLEIYYIGEGYGESNLGLSSRYQLNKGVTTSVWTGRSDHNLAVFYDTKKDKNNPDEDITVDIMLEENKVPTPEINLDPDTWDLTISCHDKKATIYYTTDNSDPDTNSPVYSNSFKLTQFTRVKAYAVHDGYAPSEMADKQYNETILQIPLPKLEYVGGKGNNEFKFTNRVDGVTTYYRFDSNSLNDSEGRYTYDGNPIVIEDGTFIKAYSVKDKLADSEVFERTMRLLDFITMTPQIDNHQTFGEDYENYSDIKEKFLIWVPEGKAYYRIKAGKQEFSSDENIDEGEWTLYNTEVNDGWIELPGGALSGNQTVQVYAETEGKARSVVGNYYTDWVMAKKPKAEYNNYQLKLSTDVPGGIIKYNLGSYDNENALTYSANDLPNGIDVKEQYVVTYWVEAPGYAESQATYFYRDERNLNRPIIEFKEDGYLHITHEKEDVTLAVECEPKSVYEQPGYEVVATNHIKFNPDYNTTVRASVTKWGWNDSEKSVMTPLEKPTINLYDNNRISFWIPYYYEDVDVRYTVDGSTPTKESTQYTYEEFTLTSGTVRVVCFMDGCIPSEADPLKVLEQAATPEIIFNYDRSKEQRKIKLACATQGAKIYYNLSPHGDGINDLNRKEYDAAANPDGIDVGESELLIAYAEAEGYRRSQEISKWTNEGSLNTPEFSIKDNVLTFTHNDKTVTIVPTFFIESEDNTYEPEDLVYDKENNKITCTVKNNTTVKWRAEKAGYYPSYDNYTYPLGSPSLSYADGYATAEHYDDQVTVKFTDGDDKEMQPEPDDPLKVKVPYNTTIKAYAYRKDAISSRSEQVKATDAPVISTELFKVTIKGKGTQTLYYTLDGSLPTESSTLYEGPFYITETCKVRAAAFAWEQVPSEASLDITYRRSLKPEVKSYDGRYVTLGAEEGSTIKYVIGSNKNVNNGEQATGKIDLGGLNEIRAIAVRSDADDSEEFSYTPEYYANETNAYTTKAGVLKEAFNWCTDQSIISSLTVNGPILGTDTEDNGGYAFLRGLPELRHLDLSDVTDAAVPENALNGSKLISVSLPKTMKEAGAGLFGADNTTLCALELPGDAFAPATLLEGVNNPNVLLYAKSKNHVEEAVNAEGVNVKNIIVLGNVNGVNRSDNVTLSHANAFYAPKSFTAQKITFTRPFTRETQIDGLGSGWETMTVPFNVQTVECGERTLKPFGVANLDASESPFWLFKGGDTDWESVSFIEANTPYLIAFPNNPLYDDKYNVNGNVTFSANNISVPMTPEESDMTSGFGAGKYLIGNYNFIEKDPDILALNDEEYSYNNHTFLPGGIFVADQKDVVPFECYVWGDGGVKGMPVFDQSAVDDLLGDTGVRIWSESYDIYVRSGIAMKVRIYDTVGQLIRSVNVKAGETVRIQDITPGIYFVGNTKILVKK